MSMSSPLLPTKLPLTVIILCHRNDDRLRRAVASAQFAQEVLLVDTSETVDFTQVCQEYECSIVERTSPDARFFDFATIRNEALSSAHHDWVFFLDSDEEIAQDSIPLIWHQIQTQQFDGVFVKRVDHFLGQTMEWGETGNFWVLRMGKRNLLRFLRPVHEVARISGNVTSAQIVLNHYPHPTIGDFFSKIAGYAKLEAHYRISHHQPLYLWEMVIFPLGKFLANYIFRLGLLDGWRGLIYAIMMSLHSLFVRVYQFELTHDTSTSARS